jgi:hypothetical protein
MNAIKQDPMGKGTHSVIRHPQSIPGLDMELNLPIIPISAAFTARKEQTGLKL